MLVQANAGRFVKSSLVIPPQDKANSLTPPTEFCSQNETESASPIPVGPTVCPRSPAIGVGPSCPPYRPEWTYGALLVTKVLFVLPKWLQPAKVPVSNPGFVITPGT